MTPAAATGGEPSGSNEFQDPNEWVIHGTPLSERIDTSRWPGIIDCVSAATGYSSKDNARAKTWLVLVRVYGGLHSPLLGP